MLRRTKNYSFKIRFILYKNLVLTSNPSHHFFLFCIEFYISKISFFSRKYLFTIGVKILVQPSVVFMVVPRAQDQNLKAKASRNWTCDQCKNTHDFLDMKSILIFCLQQWSTDILGHKGRSWK